MRSSKPTGSGVSLKLRVSSAVTFNATDLLAKPNKERVFDGGAGRVVLGGTSKFDKCLMQSPRLCPAPDVQPVSSFVYAPVRPRGQP